jgi:hypothetical protein
MRSVWCYVHRHSLQRSKLMLNIQAIFTVFPRQSHYHRYSRYRLLQLKDTILSSDKVTRLNCIRGMHGIRKIECASSFDFAVALLIDLTVIEASAFN